jgi:glycosyltransferase involved in cell wall biosynthesis
VQVKDSLSIADALTEMATNKGERKRRGKNAKAFIQKHFHIDRTVEGYIHLYQRLLR